jgi:hypothetical protein
VDSVEDEGVTPPADTVPVGGDAQALRFNPWLTCNHLVVRTVCDNMLHYIESNSGRQRKLRAKDRETFEVVVRCIMANLALAVAMRLEPPKVAVSFRAARQAQTRYDRKGFSSLPVVLERLASFGPVFTIEKSRTKGRASTVTGSGLLSGWARFNWHGKPYFAEVPGRETITLSRTVTDSYDRPVSVELIDYPDNAVADCLRAEMAIINAMLSRAQIDLEDEAQPIVTSANRTLDRKFKLTEADPEGTVRFDQGGRLFGAWFQQLPKEQRRFIRIAGEPIAELDFASLFLRLAYLEAGIAPPDGDLYSAVSVVTDDATRQGVKTVCSAMLFRRTPLQRLPSKAKALFPSRVSARIVREAILAAHPKLAGVFETGIGLHLMAVESRILVAALLRLAGKNVPALPIHDCLLVARSQMHKAALAMGDAAEEVVGFRLPVTPKASY